jgi:hypothetical protein
MSYDFDTLPRACQHRQVGERLVLENDFVTLRYVGNTSGPRLRAPINNVASVRLSINGTLVGANHPVYGFTVEDDELAIAPDRRSKIVLRRQLRHSNLIIEAVYTTTTPFCKQCGGKGQVNDLDVGANGQFVTCADTRKLVQRSLKYLLTSSCAFYPNLVCRLRDMVGHKWGFTLTAEDVAMEVHTVLDKFKQVQQRQGRYQRLSPREILKNVEDVAAQPSSQNPSVVIAGVKVSSYDGSTQDVMFGLKVRA